MGWRNVVITQHCKVSSKFNTLIVQTSDDIHEIPLADINELLLQTTRAVITTHALSECLGRDIKVIYCDEKSMPIGESTPYYSNNTRVTNLKRQIRWQSSRKDLLWQQIVKEKIGHQALTLASCHCDDAGTIASLAKDVRPGDSDNREAVAAHMYFPRLFTYEFTRSDGLNPVNALLDYGYSLLLSATARQICADGYLTELGIHHNNDQNPFNLACDLMEPFRPYMDCLIFGLDDRVLSPKTKQILIKSLLSPQKDKRGTISRQILLFVQQSLRYLSRETEALPHLGFVEEASTANVTSKHNGPHMEQNMPEEES